MTARWNPPIPDGDELIQHYCPDCRNPWDWCSCPKECGSFRFADCPLPMGHAGLCVDRETS